MLYSLFLVRCSSSSSFIFLTVLSLSILERSLNSAKSSETFFSSNWRSAICTVNCIFYSSRGLLGMSLNSLLGGTVRIAYRSGARVRWEVARKCSNYWTLRSSFCCLCLRTAGERFSFSGEWVWSMESLNQYKVKSKFISDPPQLIVPTVEGVLEY